MQAAHQPICLTGQRNQAPGTLTVYLLHVSCYLPTRLAGVSVVDPVLYPVGSKFGMTKKEESGS